MKKYLIVSGCSWGDPNFISTEHPEMDTFWPKWPEILGEKLNLNVINLCRSGQGQEYIYSTLIDKIQTIPKEEIELVIPAWTTAPRRDYQMSGFQTNKQIWTADRFDMRGCIEYWIDKSIRYYYSFQTIMEYHKIRYKQVQMVNLYTGYIWELIRQKTGNLNYNEDKLEGDSYEYKQKYKKICREQVLYNPHYNKINEHFINFNHTRIPNVKTISDRDLHPSEEGQKTIAEYIYDRLG